MQMKSPVTGRVVNGMASSATFALWVPYDGMNYKRHNQGLRSHVRRKYTGGYWLPKWARKNYEKDWIQMETEEANEAEWLQAETDCADETDSNEAQVKE